MLSFSVLLSVLLVGLSAESMQAHAEQAMARGELERARDLLEAAWAHYATNPTPDGEKERAVAKALASALIGLGRYREAEVWLKRLEERLERSPTAPQTAALAELRRQQAVLARLLGDPARSQRLLEEAEALAARSADRRLAGPHRLRARRARAKPRGSGSGTASLRPCAEPARGARWRLPPEASTGARCARPRRARG